MNDFGMGQGMGGPPMGMPQGAGGGQPQTCPLCGSMLPPGTLPPEIMAMAEQMGGGGGMGMGGGMPPDMAGAQYAPPQGMGVNGAGGGFTPPMR
jgi:hypothetical protein